MRRPGRSGAVREGATEARVEGRFTLDGGTGDETEVVLARVVPTVGRSRGYVERPARHRRRADGVGTAPGRSPRAARAPVAPRTRRAAFVARPCRWRCGSCSTRSTARTRGRRSVRSATNSPRSAATSSARAARSICCSYQLAEIDGAAIESADEDDRLAADEEVLADAEAHREALAIAYEALEGAAEDALGRRGRALVGRAPFAPTRESSATRCRPKRQRRRATHASRWSRSSSIRNSSTAVQARRARLRELMRKYGPDARHGARIREGCARSARRARRTRAAARSSALEAELAPPPNARARPRRSCRGPAGTAEPLAAAVTAQLRELAMPKARFEIEITEADLSDDGVDDVSFLLAPEPGRGAAAAGAGRVRRRAVARDAGTARRALGGAADPGVRRGGRRYRRRSRLGRRSSARRPGRSPSSAVRDPPATGRRLRRCAPCGDRSRSAGDARDAAAVPSLDDARVAELARMLAGDLDSTRAREHARELLDRAATARTEVRAR